MDLEFPFMGGIDITHDYEFTGSRDPPSDYQIIEVYDAQMINITIGIGYAIDKPEPPPREVCIP